MLVGVTVRNMGVQSSPEIIAGAASHAEASGLESVWITDHIAIPPDDAEGSGGRYLDTLTTLAWLAGVTSTIKLGSGVLILPYRPPLPTAKAVATVQEVSRGRLLLGVGVGWMEAEFRAVGVPRAERGRRTDDTLEFLHECFDNETVTANGQPLLFKPRPPAPPIYIGGGVPFALERALRHGDGWMPMTRSAERLATHLDTYRALADAKGTTPGPVTVMTGLPLSDLDAAKASLDAYRALGVERLVCAITYDDLDQYRSAIDRLATALR